MQKVRLEPRLDFWFQIRLRKVVPALSPLPQLVLALPFFQRNKSLVEALYALAAGMDVRVRLRPAPLLAALPAQRAEVRFAGVAGQGAATLEFAPGSVAFRTRICNKIANAAPPRNKNTTKVRPGLQKAFLIARSACNLTFEEVELLV